MRFIFATLMPLLLIGEKSAFAVFNPCMFLRAIAYSSETPLTQAQLAEAYLALRDSVPTHLFVKDVPILVFELREGDTLDSIPEPLRNYLGSVDYRGESYTDDYIARNYGGAIALQYAGGKPDFYIVGSDVYQSRYEPDQIQNVATKNKKNVEWSQANSYRVGTY